MTRLDNGDVLYATDYVLRIKHKHRRDERRAEGRCVNDTNARTHARPTKGCRCDACTIAHKRSA